MASETVKSAFEILQKAMADKDWENMVFAAGMVHGENIKLRAQIVKLGGVIED